MKLAPIVLFVYNRPFHTKQVLNSLLSNKLITDTVVYIFSDGPKDQTNSEEVKKINDVREICNGFKSFFSIELIESTYNKGLANSVITGVTEILNRYESVIVLEDDIVVSNTFLNYMNAGLNYYMNENRVASIHAYSFSIVNLPEFYFLRGADCWGWGTWRRSWNLFEPDGTLLYEKLKANNLEYDFNIYNSYNYMQMLMDQILKKNNSWAIRWYASAYLNNQLTLYPGKSFVKNIGFDGSGTHSGSINHYNNKNLNETFIFNFDSIEISESINAKIKISKFNKKLNNNNVFKILFKKLLKKINK